MLNILCIGDVVGNIGCNFLVSRLPLIKKEENIDITVVNGENSADGNGITPLSAESLFSGGADVITTGNHCFKRKEIYETLEENEFIIRPQNFPKGAPGKGVCILDKGKYRVAVINLMGTMYMESLASPFETLDNILKGEELPKVIMVDFHAEATSEKKALGYFADGRVSAIFGTHTHVQTADECVLPKGTGFITDLGMTGPYNSVLGVKSEIIVSRFTSCMPQKFEFAEGECELNGCIFTVDEKSGKTVKVKRINIK